MDLQTTAETFLLWIQSCKTNEQLELLENIQHEFVDNRFKDVVQEIDLVPILITLKDAFKTQSKLIAASININNPLKIPDSL